MRGDCGRQRRRRKFRLTAAACLALAAIAAQTAHAAPDQHIGNWTVSESTNALTDAKSYAFILVSSDTPRDILGVQRHATLGLLCDPSGSMFLNVHWPDFIEPTELGSIFSNIAWRFDDRPMQTGRWLMVETHDQVSVLGKDAAAMAGALAASHRFVVGITGRNGQQTATFDLAGSDQLPKLLADSCGIDVTAPQITSSRLALPPAPVAQVGPEVTFASDRPPEAVMAAARKLLTAQGFAIGEGAPPGALTTTMAPYPLTTAMADCGGMLGISYLSDRRAHTQLQVIVRAADGKVGVSTSMLGVYATGYGGKDKPLICKTKLTFEKTLADQLKAVLS
jgi:hypothetical protein